MIKYLTKEDPTHLLQSAQDQGLTKQGEFFDAQDLARLMQSVQLQVDMKPWPYDPQDLLSFIDQGGCVAVAYDKDVIAYESIPQATRTCEESNGKLIEVFVSIERQITCPAARSSSTLVSHSWYRFFKS